VSPLPAQRLTLLVYLALAASLVLAVAVAVLATRLRAARRTYAALLAGGHGGEDLLAAVARQIEATERLRGSSTWSAGRRPSSASASPAWSAPSA